MLNQDNTVRVTHNRQVTIKDQVSIPLFGGDISSSFISFTNLPDGEEHIAVKLGDYGDRTPLVRLHSECLTGDVFMSARCDCGSQLEEAINKINQEGGYIIYLRQEGRGIGLFNKLKAYRLQDSGFDTYEANEKLSFNADERDYSAAAQMLFALGINKIRLLSNNPRKKMLMEELGITIEESVRTGLFVNLHNRHYIETKSHKGGHHFQF